MALSETLPIYLDTYELLRRLMRLVPRLPKVYRYNIGQRLLDTCLDLMVLIYETNASREKLPLLERLLRKYEVLTMLMRLLFEEQQLTSQQYAPYVELLAKIGRQATGWKNHYSA